MESIVKITALSKFFARKPAVNNVDMTINRGDIYGFIGKNGAGKTTLIRMILGLAEKSSGEIKLFNSDKLIENRDKIGCIIENPGYFPKMTAKNNLLAQARVMGINMSDSEIEDVLTTVGLDPKMNKKAKDFSLGMKQRLAIAIALIGNIELLILDEPTNGLDPEGIRDIRNLILKLNKEKNITVLISSHILSELHKFATRYGVIDNGKIIKEFSAEELDEVTKNIFEIKVKELDFDKAKSIIDISNIEYTFNKNNSTFEIKNNNDNEFIIKKLSTNEIIPISYNYKTSDLEEYFMSLVGGKTNE